MSEIKPPSAWNRCLDCKDKGKNTKVRVGFKDRFRRARPHCPACGSTRLEEVVPINEGDRVRLCVETDGVEVGAFGEVVKIVVKDKIKIYKISFGENFVYVDDSKVEVPR